MTAHAARLDLRFAARGGSTVIESAFAESPFKITRLHDARWHDIPHLILMQCTPGVFGGDMLECSIQVGAGAKVAITQQSATKVHPSQDRMAVLRSRIRVEAGGELHLLNETVIPFAESKLRQSTFIDAEAGSCIHYWDGLMAGRIGSGEVWRFAHFESETRLESGGRLLYLDRCKLVPEDGGIAGRWVLGANTYLANGVSFTPHCERMACELRKSLPAAGVDTPEPGLLLVRAATNSGPDWHRYREAFARAAARGG